MKNILMAIKDYETTTITSPIVEKTIAIASNCASKVQIIHIVPPSQQSPYNVDRKLFRHELAIELRHEHDCLQHLAKSMRKVNIDAKALLLQGSTIKTILQESERLAVDLVVLGHHKHSSLYKVLMNDTDESLLAKCSCPIMFIPN
ncbi:MAG: universal stress protein [Gammaproteobacteria bacterium]|nr:universal stress protein [Gammaproteobacteria bacterium]